MSKSPPPENAERAREFILTGRVQGVGFRPFVFRLAHNCGLRGWVRNEAGQVRIHAEGAEVAIEQFARELIAEAPPLSRPEISSLTDKAVENRTDFQILESAIVPDADIHLPPDLNACADCIDELRDRDDRRYRYPFINCTQCGPRYTIITAFPYDRPNTTMATFELCPECRREYIDPADRRYHAEPVACPVCGPAVKWLRPQQTEARGEAALTACVDALSAGEIVAVKGIGGYHLMCDARNDTTVSRLRVRKKRPDKPLAVMFPQTGKDGLDAVRAQLELHDAEAACLRAPSRPIVLCRKSGGYALSPNLAPGLAELGAFLPYSPLHVLLLDGFGGPVVATSGNLSGEPVLTRAPEAEQRLARIADGFLHHNRPIARPADDPVKRLIAGRPAPIRHGRGSAPVEMALPAQLPRPLLATGGHMKNAIALGWNNRAVLSPHIGELDTPRSLDVFAQVIDDLQALYQVHPEVLVCDAHPHYAGTKWAMGQPLPVHKVYHHHAHASALAGEFADVETWMTFTWDGVGMGEDDTLWGGEAFIGSPGHWRRVASMVPFRPVGADRAGREPWRSASALCWQSGIDWMPSGVDAELARQAWQRNINTPTTSAVGRLFDAASCLIGGINVTSFEGQGPMMLEAMSGYHGETMRLPLNADNSGVLRTDWAPLLPKLMDTTRPASDRASDFHATMAGVIVDQVNTVRQSDKFDAVGLTGGVFQNRILSELVTDALKAKGIAVYLPRQIPANDGGLAYGQIVEALYSTQEQVFPNGR